MPTVSVIMPCFNHGRFVAESAGAILGQTLSDLELIIIDDCSSDNSWAAIRRVAQRDRRVIAIRHAKNQGASRSRNDGLRAAKGELIGFCDADDLWEPEKLARQAELLRCHPEYDVAFCDAFIIDEDGALTGERFSDRFPVPHNASGRYFEHLLRRNFINMQSVLMRRKCLRHAASFDEHIKWVEDWWYWVRLSRRHRFGYTPECLARYRVHGHSTNLIQKRGYCVNRFKVFRRMLNQYSDLSHEAKVNIAYQMGIELCEIRKFHFGFRLLMDAATASPVCIRTLPYLPKSCRRMLIYLYRALRRPA